MKNKINQLQILEEQGFFNLQATKVVGREFISGGVRSIDFCQTNYLGYDYDARVIEKGIEFVKEWGILTATSRMEVDPQIYHKLETRLSSFLGASKTMLAHTITMNGFSVIPSIVEKGVILADSKVHTVVWEACRLARDHGATLLKFQHQDTGDLESLLKKNAHFQNKMIAVDGVYSISTEVTPVHEIQKLCEKYDAYLYVDDAHGFGVLGRGPSQENPYGIGGSGVLDFAGVGNSRIFYASSFGKAFCCHTAFLTIPPEFKKNLRAYSTQYLFSAPLSPFNIGCVNALLDLNETEGEARRALLRERTAQFISGLKNLKISYENHFLHPVVYIKVGQFENLLTVAKTLKQSGVLPGFRAYPVTPSDECGLRFSFSSMHTEEHITRALSVLDELRVQGVLPYEKDFY
jgi:8-amino-7-oxononanoate synthase